MIKIKVCIAPSDLTHRVVPEYPQTHLHGTIMAKFIYNTNWIDYTNESPMGNSQKSVNIIMFLFRFLSNTANFVDHWSIPIINDHAPENGHQLDTIFESFPLIPRCHEAAFLCKQLLYVYVISWRVV